MRNFIKFLDALRMSLVVAMLALWGLFLLLSVFHLEFWKIWIVYAILVGVCPFILQKLEYNDKATFVWVALLLGISCRYLYLCAFRSNYSYLVKSAVVVFFIWLGVASLHEYLLSKTK